MPFTRKQIIKAIKIVLGVNYRYRLINLIIEPKRVEWHFAVSFLSDKEKIWRPQIITYFDELGKILIFNGMGDEKPTVIEAATMIYMAKSTWAQTQSPKGPDDEKPC